MLIPNPDDESSSDGASSPDDDDEAYIGGKEVIVTIIWQLFICSSYVSSPSRIWGEGGGEKHDYDSRDFSLRPVQHTHKAIFLTQTK